MNRFIDEQKERFGVEPICRVLECKVSTYYAAKKRPPSLRSLRDQSLMGLIYDVWETNYGVYGHRKVWKQLAREGIPTARCTVQRLMRSLGIQGIRRGGYKVTTISDKDGIKPPDLVDRDFAASKPNELWLADITYVRTRSGFVYVAFVIDAYSRMIVGWALETHLRTDLALEALEMATWRRSTDLAGLIHHSDRGVQFTSIRYTERLRDYGIEPSVGSVGDSYDNALAESTIGLYKTELIYNKGPWRTREHVEFATLEWIDWFNHRRLHGEIGDVPPAELERSYYDVLKEPELV